MKIINSISQMNRESVELIKSGKSIGFVPTMGYLHDGHMSLVHASKEENDITVMSIFVNPTQFGQTEDFERYPKDFERDKTMAQNSGVDYLFIPQKDEMYPEDYLTYVNVETITEKLCGSFRPGHFRGVSTIVLKLFNIVLPTKAYFGQKDAQQVFVIKKMVKDLNLNIEIVTCPIVRESDGLAMSSRNTYLSEDEREKAVIISKALFLASDIIKCGEKYVEAVKEHIKNKIVSQNPSKVDYIEILNADNFNSIEILEGSVIIVVAVWFGKTRLIDNVIVEVE